MYPNSVPLPMLLSACLGTLSLTTVLASERYDDPCQRATIPWTPSTDHARLNSGKISRVFTRNQNVTHLITDEHVHLHNGDEDVILVKFDVQLSNAALQTSVSMVQDQEDVTLMIDGEGIGTNEQPECVIANTNVFLPSSLHHFVLDTEAASINISGVSSKFDKLDFIAKAGGLKIENSKLLVKEYAVDLHAGSYKSDGGVTTETQNIEVQAGSVKASIETANQTTIRSRAGFIDLTIVKSRELAADTVPEFDIRTDSGSIKLTSELTRNARLTAISGAGHVSADFPGAVVAKVHLKSTVGRVGVPENLIIESDHKGWVGREVRGHIGTGKTPVVLDLSAKTGSVALNVEGFRTLGVVDNDTEDDEIPDEKRGPSHKFNGARSHSTSIFIISLLGIVAIAWKIGVIDQFSGRRSAYTSIPEPK